MRPLIQVDGLKVHFPVRSGRILGRGDGVVRAVDGVSLTVSPGETLGLVGESGSGKSTLGRALLRLATPTAGQIRFDGVDITNLPKSQLLPYRRRMQMVFQDPYSSLNPRHKVGRIIGEPLRAQGICGRQESRQRAISMLERVGLPPDAIERYPHAFSGGQRQRIGLARALGVSPEFVVLDEPVSSLDVSIQAQMLALMSELQEQFALTYLFIAHDLAVVQYVSDRIAVMYLGAIIELGSAEQICEAPAHPYTQALISAVPMPDPVAEGQRTRIVLRGDMPSPASPPEGCRFHTRCPYVQPTRCRTDIPELRKLGSEQQVACHWAEEIGAGEVEMTRDPFQVGNASRAHMASQNPTLTDQSPTADASGQATSE